MSICYFLVRNDTRVYYELNAGNWNDLWPTSEQFPASAAYFLLPADPADLRAQLPVVAERGRSLFARPGYYDEYTAWFVDNLYAWAKGAGALWMCTDGGDAADELERRSYRQTGSRMWPRGEPPAAPRAPDRVPATATRLLCDLHRLLWFDLVGLSLSTETRAQVQRLATELDRVIHDGIAGITPPVPRLDIVCDHQGFPGAVDPSDGKPHEYHCAECCPGADVGSSGRVEPCTLHIEGRAVALLESAPPLPRALARAWRWGARCDNPMPASAGAGHWRDWHRGHGCEKDPEVKVPGMGIGFEGVTVDVDKAERIALDILRAVGAARRGDV